jgi:hypothetical protein
MFPKEAVSSNLALDNAPRIPLQCPQEILFSSPYFSLIKAVSPQETLFPWKAMKTLKQIITFNYL